MKTSLPRILLQAEGLVVIVIACSIFEHAGFSWAWFAITFDPGSF